MMAVPAECCSTRATAPSRRAPHSAIAGSIAAADLDGDGDLDVLLANGGSPLFARGSRRRRTRRRRVQLAHTRASPRRRPRRSRCAPCGGRAGGSAGISIDRRACVSSSECTVLGGRVRSTKYGVHCTSCSHVDQTKSNASRSTGSFLLQTRPTMPAISTVCSVDATRPTPFDSIFPFSRRGPSGLGPLRFKVASFTESTAT